MIESLMPGRKLDEIIAERVMGIPKPDASQKLNEADWNLLRSWTMDFTLHGNLWVPRDFSSDLRHAWEIVTHRIKAIHGLRFECTYDHAKEGKWTASFMRGDESVNSSLSATCQTLAHAICLAALNSQRMSPTGEPRRCGAKYQRHWMKNLWLKITFDQNIDRQCYRYEGHAEAVKYNPAERQSRHETYRGEIWL